MTIVLTKVFGVLTPGDSYLTCALAGNGQDKEWHVNLGFPWLTRGDYIYARVRSSALSIVFLIVVQIVGRRLYQCVIDAYLCSRGCFNSRSKVEYSLRITDRTAEWQWPPSSWTGQDAAYKRKRSDDTAMAGPPGGFAAALRGVKSGPSGPALVGAAEAGAVDGE